MMTQTNGGLGAFGWIGGLVLAASWSACFPPPSKCTPARPCDETSEVETEVVPEVVIDDTETSPPRDTVGSSDLPEADTSLEVPAHVTASTDRAADIEIRWDTVASATAYRVFRCEGDDCGPDAPWAERTDTPTSATAFVDHAVEAPSLPGPPSGVQASIDQTDAVTVSWSTVTAPTPRAYQYRVLAVGPSGTSAPSSSVQGAAAARPVLGYQVQVDGGAWVAATSGAATEWRDVDALPATLNAGTVTASEAIYAEFVRLTATGASASHGPSRTYTIRATTAYGPGLASAPALGQRVAGSLGWHWERSSGPSAENFSPIIGATGPTFDDTGAPGDGSVRWYRATVEAAGAAPVSTQPTPGSRQPPPGVPGGVSASGDLADKVALRWTPVAGAIGYHVFRDGVMLTTGSGVATTSYDDFGAAPPTAPWEAPSDLVATTNDTERVVLTWSAPTRPLGAKSSYEVQALSTAGAGPHSAAADGRRAAAALVSYDVEVAPTGQNPTWLSAGVSDVSWVDLNPPHATITAGTATASQGEFHAGVQLALLGSGVSPGADVRYRVRGVLQAGVTPASTVAIGHRDVGDLVIQWQRTPEVEAEEFRDIAGATAAEFVDTPALGAAADGEHRWYRAVLAAAGAESQVLAPVSGWRLAFGSVDGGSGFACGHAGVNIWCWGKNSVGQLGRGYVSPTGLPEPVYRSADVIVADVILYEPAVGADHVCARTNTSALMCWGSNASGQLGDGTKTDHSQPTEVLGLGGYPLSVTAGANHTCALIAGRTVQCWGSNDYGELGNNSPSPSPSPVTVVTASGEPLSGVLQVVAGSHVTCARRATDVYCWGLNDVGQLGNQTQTASPFATKIWGSSDWTTFTQIVAGAAHVCGIWTTFPGRVRCWGSNANGRLGEDAAAEFSTIGVTVTGLSNVWQLGAMGGGTCAVIAPSGEVTCWGEGTSGQLGNGGDVDSATPVIVSGFIGNGIGGGDTFACAIADYAPHCWGANDRGQLGDDTMPANHNTPVDVRIP